jgi:hypothetical protein
VARARGAGTVADDDVATVPSLLHRLRRATPALIAGFAFAVAMTMAMAQAPDDAAFDRLLRAHVKAGHVDYPAFQDDPAFAAYVAALAPPQRLATPAERMARYVNAYNAFAIQGILEGLSPSTFLGRQRYFRVKAWPFDGGAITLYDLEHKLLRPLGDPRIHFAIICASRS